MEKPVIVAMNINDAEVTIDISELNPAGSENSVVEIRSTNSGNPATVPG